MSLRRQLDALMAGWDRWYPSVFDAARDLGLIHARVCPPSQLLLSDRLEEQRIGNDDCGDNASHNRFCVYLLQCCSMSCIQC